MHLLLYLVERQDTHARFSEAAHTTRVQAVHSVNEARVIVDTGVTCCSWANLGLTRTAACRVHRRAGLVQHLSIFVVGLWFVKSIGGACCAAEHYRLNQYKRRLVQRSAACYTATIRSRI